MAPEREQRRLAAILAADMVGYSRLMEADERGTIARQKAHRKDLIDPKITEHKGRIFKTTGDGLLAEFASVVDAVESAVAIQQAIAAHEADVPKDRRIRYRIGINLGDIVIDGDDILGEGVNVASRLEGLAEPGGIWISASAFEQVRNKLRLGFEDQGEQKLKNIARPVRAYRVLAASDAPGAVREGRRWKTVSWRWMAAVAVVAIVAGGAVWWSSPWTPTGERASVARKSTVLSNKPSIAVLPFENLSNNPAEDYFSDGITEDIINGLGRYKALAVMAYGAALSYKGQTVSAREIGRRLGVRYILEGNVRRSGRRVRVSTRLTDADRGVVLWSENFDDENKDVFAVQDAITRRIAGALVANLTRVEQRRAFAKPTQNLDAYDMVLRGRALLGRASRRGNREARRLLERAVALDPDYAAAYAWLGRAHYLRATDGWTEFPLRALKRAEAYAKKALARDPATVEAHRILSRVYAIQLHLDRAVTEIDQAIALNPSDAEAYGDRGLILMWIGRLEEAVAALDTAFVLNPNLRADYVFAFGLAYYSLRRHQDAIRVLERGAPHFPKYFPIPAVLVAAYIQVGRTDEAQRNAKLVKRIMPIFNPKQFGVRFRNRAHYEYLAEGLAKGGLK